MIFLKRAMVLVGFHSMLVGAAPTISGDGAKGEGIYKQNCTTCHGDDAMGMKEKKAPMLAGQYDWYLHMQLENFISKKRVNPDMDPYLKKLSKQDLVDVSVYLGGLK